MQSRGWSPQGSPQDCSRRNLHDGPPLLLPKLPHGSSWRTSGPSEPPAPARLPGGPEHGPASRDRPDLSPASLCRRPPADQPRPGAAASAAGRPLPRDPDSPSSSCGRTSSRPAPPRTTLGGVHGRRVHGRCEAPQLLPLGLSLRATVLLVRRPGAAALKPHPLPRKRVAHLEPRGAVRRRPLDSRAPPYVEQDFASLCFA